MIENAARRSVALLIGALAVFGTVATTAAGPQQGAVLAYGGPEDPVNVCYITPNCVK